MHVGCCRTPLSKLSAARWRWRRPNYAVVAVRPSTVTADTFPAPTLLSSVPVRPGLERQVLYRLPDKSFDCHPDPLETLSSATKINDFVSLSIFTPTFRSSCADWPRSQSVGHSLFENFSWSAISRGPPLRDRQKNNESMDVGDRNESRGREGWWTIVTWQWLTRVKKPADSTTEIWVIDLLTANETTVVTRKTKKERRYLNIYTRSISSLSGPDCMEKHCSQPRLYTRVAKAISQVKSKRSLSVTIGGLEVGKRWRDKTDSIGVGQGPINISATRENESGDRTYVTLRYVMCRGPTPR